MAAQFDDDDEESIWWHDAPETAPSTVLAVDMSSTMNALTPDLVRDDIGDVFAQASAIGRRKTYEDAAGALTLAPGVMLFYVFDGHGGADLAQYCARALPKFILSRTADWRAVFDSDESTEADALFEQFAAQMQADVLESYAKNTPGGVLPVVLVDKDAGTKREAMALNPGTQYVYFGMQMLSVVNMRRRGADAAQIHTCGTTALFTVVTFQHPGVGLRHVHVSNIGDSIALLVGMQATTGQGAYVRLNRQHRPIEDEEHTDEIQRAEAVGLSVERGRIGGANIGSISVSRSLGDVGFSRFASPTAPFALLPHDKQPVTWQPEHSALTAQQMGADDFEGFRPLFLIVACDGLWDVMSLEKVTEFVLKMYEGAPKYTGDLPFAQHVAASLVGAALACEHASDNITVLLYVITPPPHPPK